MNKESSSFEAQVLQADKPVLVDFWAPWCGPCKGIGIMVDKLAEIYGDRILFAKCNADDSQQTAAKYGKVSEGEAHMMKCVTRITPIALAIFPVQAVKVSDTRPPRNRFNYRDFVNNLEIHSS